MTNYDDSLDLERLADLPTLVGPAPELGELLARVDGHRRRRRRNRQLSGAALGAVFVAGGLTIAIAVREPSDDIPIGPAGSSASSAPAPDATGDVVSLVPTVVPSGFVRKPDRIMPAPTGATTPAGEPAPDALRIEYDGDGIRGISILLVRGLPADLDLLQERNGGERVTVRGAEALSTVNESVIKVVWNDPTGLTIDFTARGITPDEALQVARSMQPVP